LVDVIYIHIYREDKFCIVEMEVRDCELDQYGLVSSAVYAEYIENGRYSMCSAYTFTTWAFINLFCTWHVRTLHNAHPVSAREEVASRLGIGRDSIAGTGNAMALSELNLNYFGPLKVRDDDAHCRQMVRWMRRQLTQFAFYKQFFSVALGSLSW
jgi:acyl-CoA thioesterase FadM